MRHARDLNVLPPHRPSRLVAAVASAALVGVVSVVAVPTLVSAAPVTVTGTVFEDLDSDGVYEPTGTPAETGAAGIEVTITGADVGEQWTTTTADDGTYSLAVDPAGTDVRVEFALSSAQIEAGYRSSFAAPDGPGVRSGSSVQFLDLTAGTTADYGVLVPEDYSTGSANLLIPVQRGGDPLLETTTDERALVSVPWSAAGQDPALQTVRASTSTGTGAYGTAVGTVWGNAYDRTGKVAYTSALLRRFGGLGTGNLGGVYRTDLQSDQTSVWIDLEQAGIDVGGSVLDGALGLSPGASAADRNAARGLLADRSVPIIDEKVFDLPGKVGLGAAVTDLTGTAVYVANLHERTVVVVPVQADGSAGAPFEVTVPGLGTDDVVFGLHIHRGHLYVGVTSTALGDGDGSTTAAAEAGRSGLGARVLSAPLAEVSDPVDAPTATWTTALTIDDLSFRRGPADVSYVVYGPNNYAALDADKTDRATHWNAWSDDWAGTVWPTCLNDANQANTNEKYCAFPQPVLSAIDFDTAGNMVVGFADRWSWQSGDGQHAPVAGNTQVHFSFASGDVYLAGQQADGSYLLEDAGAITSVTGNRTATWTDQSPAAGANTPGDGATDNGNGPGGGEFFYDRNRPDSSATNTATHYESTTGALAVLTGVAQFPVTSYSSQGSANGQFYGSGPKWLSADDGTSSRAYDVLSQGELGSWPNVRAFGKAGGLGDLQLLLDAAPVQIGNRVWYDADRDGVQDPGETGLSGVTVDLLSADGTTLVATTTTDAQGRYLFDSLTDDLEPGTDYQVRFVPPEATEPFPPVPGYTWGDVGLTSQGTAASTIDSNPDATTGIAAVSVGGPGQNDHTIDAGYRLAVGSITLTKAWASDSSFVTVPTTWSITAQYSYAGPDGTVTDTVTIDQTTTSAAATIDHLPFGVPITLSEPTVSGVPSGADNAVTWALLSGSGATVTDNGDGTATLVLTDPGTGPVPTPGVGVTNTLDARLGGFSLAKILAAGSPASVDDHAFLVDVTYPAGYTGSGTSPLSVVPGEAAVTVTDLPVGSEVTLCEQTPTGLPADADWQGSTWFVGGAEPGPGSVDAGGCLTLTVADGPAVALVLSNDVDQVLGGFTVDKQLDDTGDGTAAGRVATHTFQVEVQVGGGAVQTLDVVAGQSPLAGLTGIPAGTTVRLREVAPTDLPTDVDWGGATWTRGGTTLTPDGSGWVTITVDDGTAALVVTNAVERLYGAVTLAKTVSGPAEGFVTSSTTFSFEVQTRAPGGTWPPTSSVSIVRDDTPETISVPAGYGFRVREIAPSGTPAQVAWEDRTFTVGGVARTPDADGWITVDPVADGVTVAVQVDNATSVITDGFQVTKTFEGELDGAGQPGFPAGRLFTVHAEYDLPDGAPDGTPTFADLEVTTTSPTVAVSGLPVGTVVHLSEPTVPSAPGDTVTWDSLSWTGPVGSTVVGGVLSFTIPSGGAVQVELENTFDVKVQDLTVTKSVVGGAAAAIGSWSVSVDYSYTDASTDPVTPVSGTLTLTDTAPTGTIDDVPASAVVTLRETSVSAPPAGASWIDPVWTVGGTTLVPDAVGAVTVTGGTNGAVAVALANPLEAPDVTIRKGDAGTDGAGTTIVNDADTMDDAAQYTPGESRRIVLELRNSGSEALTDVVVTDETLGGADVADLACTFPGEASATGGVLAGGHWTVSWAASFGSGASTWAVDDTFRCTAVLTVDAADGVHADRATVTARGEESRTPVTDSNDYNAFTAAIQVVKYDGDTPDPSVTDGVGAWTPPAKPLADADQDANDVDHAVRYDADSTHPVRWVVTNTGPTYLTRLTLADVTGDGPDVVGWVCDLDPVGGVSGGYDFVADGPWDGLLAPGASFFCHGTLTLGANQTHADVVTVTGDVVVPAVDAGGVPIGAPATVGGVPVVATVDGGGPWTLTDDDPFHAYATGVPGVTIVKGDTGDGPGTSVVNDANTMVDGEWYAPGERRTVALHLTNTGSEPLVDVVVTDTTLGGPDLGSLACRFPGDADATAGTWSPDTGWTVTWAATVTVGSGSSTTVWATGVGFDCTATLTVLADGGVHADRATVVGTGQVTGLPVTDTDDYNAFTAGIQVIKYDGAGPDPIVGGGGAWVIPAKPLTDADQDANDTAHAVEQTDGVAQAVRWVVTNTGPTYLTTIDLSDRTDTGPSIGSWTCDLGPVGGPGSHSFVRDGAWRGLLAPGASFFCEGPLTLTAGQSHADTVTVTANVVVPEVDADGRPTGAPMLVGGAPVLATGNDGSVLVLTDDDPYHATVPAPGLPVTGAQVLGVLGLASLLVLLGTAVLGLSRRRRA